MQGRGQRRIGYRSPSGSGTNAQAVIQGDALQVGEVGDVENVAGKGWPGLWINVSSARQHPVALGKKRQCRGHVLGAGIGGHSGSDIVCIHIILAADLLPVNSVAKAGFGGYLGGMSGKYVLDEQIGYVLRRVTQRHLALFSDAIPEVTTVQFAVLARLVETGPQSQNLLGRGVAMDAATVKGVVDRLARQGLVETHPDPGDKRRLTVGLTQAGLALFEAKVEQALAVSHRTLDPLKPAERAQLMALLSKLT